jgi:osmotically inducible protein OsmC
MTLSAALERARTPPVRIATKATATLEKLEAGFRLTKMNLEVSGQVPGIDQAALHKAAEAAKDGCPVSNALKGNMTFQLEATLE